MRLRPALALPLLLLCPALPSRSRGSGEAPALLSQTGLTLKDGKPTDPSLLAYAPQYPLWSDGAAKRRWIHLPPGGKIDASDPDKWDFPVGTKVWKEFSFQGRKAETRLIWKAGPKQWVYATYRWRPDGSDADLVPAEGVKQAIPIAEGKAHSLPSVEQCKACHENGRPELLGFSALQLSAQRDPMAPHAEPLEEGMVTLDTLVDQDRFTAPHPGWKVNPPRIAASTPRARAALGYLHSNCGSCHQSEGPNARLNLDFRHPLNTPSEAQSPAYLTAVDQRSRWIMPGVPKEDQRRIAPGHPELSVAFYRMGQRKGIVGMPQIATVLVDDEALALVKGWIQEDLKPVHPR